MIYCKTFRKWEENLLYFLIWLVYIYLNKYLFLKYKRNTLLFKSQEVWSIDFLLFGISLLEKSAWKQTIVFLNFSLLIKKQIIFLGEWKRKCFKYMANMNLESKLLEAFTRTGGFVSLKKSTEILGISSLPI